MQLDWWHQGEVHECGHWHISTILCQWLVLGMSHCWLHGWQWQGATGSWHHWGQREYVQWRVGIFSCNLSSHDMQQSRRCFNQGSHSQLQHVGLCSVCTVVLCNVMPIGTEVLYQVMHRYASISVLWYARRAINGSLPEHFALVRSHLTIFTAASPWPLLLGFLRSTVLWSKF